MASSPVILKSISCKKEFDSNSEMNSNLSLKSCVYNQDNYLVPTQLKTKFCSKIHSNPDPPVSFLFYVQFSAAKKDSIATLNFFLLILRSHAFLQYLVILFRKSKIVVYQFCRTLWRTYRQRENTPLAVSLAYMCTPWHPLFLVHVTSFLPTGFLRKSFFYSRGQCKGWSTHH